MPFLIFCKTKL